MGRITPKALLIAWSYRIVMKVGIDKLREKRMKLGW
jgi:hypothetical protein